ncbi:MAG: anthranilate synthase component I [Alphaproteobacteria bacterium]
MSGLSQPTLEEFSSHFIQGKTQLLYRWAPADMVTPVAAYLKLCGGRKNSFLLESVEGGSVLGRYSIIGLDPDIIWSCEGDQVKTWHNYGSWNLSNDDPLPALREMIKACKIDIEPEGLPPMAVSGIFGYMGYDMIRMVEDIPDDNPDTLNIPDSIFMRPTALVIFDNVKNMICIVTPVYLHGHNTKKSAKKIYAEAEKTISALAKNLLSSLKFKPQSSAVKLPLHIESNTTETEYHAMIDRAIEYIRAGDIFQVVLSQRFWVDFDLPPFELYRSLRRLNPSPFLFHFQFEGFALVGSSPEILVRVRDKELTIRPIAGTRIRGKNAAEDEALAADLLGDPKERAEHLMLLDLGRNDVGRVAEIGSVKVTDQFVVEYYSHVMHIVSNVIGTVRNGLDILDALFAGFPAGTVSGAPKIRAMQIIDELEKDRRSYYAGCVGYISGNGNMDTCIALRTALIKDGKLYIQSGAGIVADSQKDSEYSETVNKAKALVKAAEDALSQHRA